MELEFGGLEIEIKGWQGLVTLIGTGLVAAALAGELAKPTKDRTWHGRVGGIVPYEFRPPTWKRLKAAWWNPRRPVIASDKFFGVGWDVNLGAVAHKLGFA